MLTSLPGLPVQVAFPRACQGTTTDHEPASFISGCEASTGRWTMACVGLLVFHAIARANASVVLLLKSVWLLQHVGGDDDGDGDGDGDDRQSAAAPSSCCTYQRSAPRHPMP